MHRIIDKIKGVFLGSKQPTQEIYSPDLDKFVSASEPSGQATGILRPPTIEERYQMDKMGTIGKTVFGVEKKSEGY